MRRLLSRPDALVLIRIFALFTVYFVTVRISLDLGEITGFTPLLWPPSAIGLTALFLYGYELWPGILLAAFFANLLGGATVPYALFIAAGFTLQPLAGAFLLRYVSFDPMLARLRDSFAIIATSFIASLISPTVRVLGIFALQGASANLSMLWLTWWESASLGMLIMSPFLMRWLRRVRFYKSPPETIEWVMLFFFLSLVSYFIFWRATVPFHDNPLVYMLLALLTWAALRTGPRGTTFALFLVSGMSISAAAYGAGSFANDSFPNMALLYQVFLGALAVIYLIFVSAVEERKESVILLEQHINKLESALNKIQSADEAKSEFIATLAHELRNPLSPIVSALELIKLNGISPGNERLTEVIDSHLKTMVTLLDDLLDVTRITHKKFKLQKQVVQLQSIARNSNETVAVFFKARGHSLTLSLPKEPVWLMADPVRLEQIFVNLLFNAAKYTEPGGKVSLSCKKTNGLLRICIKDNGIGIEPHMLSSIFEPFIQAPQHAHTHIGTGLGIGLSLTKRLVELHGGRIWAQSDGLGKGSEFTVELPIPPHVQLPLPQLPAAPLKSRVAVPHDLKILIVDDNQIAAQVLGDLLSRDGHEIWLSYDGPSALAQVERSKPNVVLLDIGLPGMDGFEVAKKIRQLHGQKINLIALTGYGQEDDKKKAREAGFNHHLVKPVSIDDVRKVLKK